MTQPRTRTRSAAAGLGLLVVAIALLAAPACRPRIVVSAVERASCTQEVTEAFGDQAMAMVAVRARDGGPLFRPPILEALDRVCEGFEDAMTDDLVATKCLTNLPIMEGRPGGARVVVARDEFPMALEDALAFQRLVLQLEFAFGDVVDVTGGLHSFIHLPAPSYEGVDLEAIFDELVAAEGELLELALDRGDPDDAAAYRAVAGDGPSARYLVGIFDSGTSGGIKEPESLRAMERFQMAAEALPKVAQTFSVADDLKVVRRGLHKGNPAEAIIPPRRAEVAQLLLALGMAPSGNAFGPRMDTEERVALVRVNFASMPQEAFTRLGKRVDALLSLEAPEGGRAFLCLQ